MEAGGRLSSARLVSVGAEGIGQASGVEEIASGGDGRPSEGFRGEDFVGLFRARFLPDALVTLLGSLGEDSVGRSLPASTASSGNRYRLAPDGPPCKVRQKRT
jgi:hypothetical protein